MSVAVSPPFDEPRGVVGLFVGTDHKAVARHLAITAFGFFLAGGILALIMRAELAAPGMQVTSRNGYDQIFTMHGSTMIYLFVTPFALALGTYLVPLQVGAAEIFAPRVNLTGFWLYVLGGVVIWGGWPSINGSGSAAWTAEYPQSAAVNTPGQGMDLWIAGVMLAALGMMLLAGCMLATVVARRAPGMTMLRLPVFTWTQVVTCLMVLTSFPSLLLAMGLLLADRHGHHIYTGAGGATAYQDLFWFYGHPVVYVMFFPFVGASLEVISTFSRRRTFGYKGIVVSLLLFAALSMSVWGHHMFTTGQVPNGYFALNSHLLAIPAGLEYIAAIGTLIGGSIVFRTPMLFAIAFFLQFLIGGVSGIYVGSPPLDYHVHDTYFVVAHFHYTLLAGSAFGLFAGVYYWFPKVTGMLLREGLGKLHFWLMVIGTHMTFVPMFFLGYEGMPRRIADYFPSNGWEGLNTVATVGAGIIALSILVFLVNAAVSLVAGRRAGPDPWEAHTLEWVTSSPPPRFNFDSPLPPVRSPEPLLDLREARRAEVTA
jgi:cytochrome c oxidase subunit 1